MGNRIICISRQFGSGGHEISVKTADLLRLRVYEKELVHLACEYGGDEHLAGELVAVTSVLAIVTVFFFIFTMKQIGGF